MEERELGQWVSAWEEASRYWVHVIWEFDFCINYYGIVQDVEEVEGLKCPVQLALGGEDERVNTWAFQSFLPAAGKHKKRVDLHLYPNVRHAFHRPNWEGHDPDAARDAWAKTLLFLSQSK